MCNFSKVSLETENHCPVCQCRGLVKKIFHSFVYHNGHEESITHHHHCGDCGINVTPTQKNRLDIGDEDRFMKAKFLFEETHLVNLDNNFSEIFGYYSPTKNSIKEIKLTGLNSWNLHSIHILNQDFDEKNATQFVQRGNNSNLFFSNKVEGENSIPLVKAFAKQINYLEIFVPIDSILFK
ncbi:MAG: hypothetical protein WC011_03300 [Candidatus Paceibacterota bacterium]